MCDGSILQCTISSSFDTVIKYMTFSHYAIPPSQQKKNNKKQIITLLFFYPLQ